MKVRILACCTFSTLDDRWAGPEAEAAAGALRAAGFQAAVQPENHADRDEAGIGAFVETWRDAEIEEPDALDNIISKTMKEIEHIVGNAADVYDMGVVPLNRPPFRHDERGYPI